LHLWCGNASKWSKKQEVIEAFKSSSMWVEWVKAGYRDYQLGQCITHLKKKYLKSPKMKK